MKSHTHNNEEMAFVYMEMHAFLALLIQERSYEDSVGHRHSAGEYEAVLCKNEGKYFVRQACLLKKKKLLEKLGFINFTYVNVTVYFTAFESVIISRNTHRPCYVSKRAYSCRIREF